jgi:hypothetical protein
VPRHNYQIKLARLLAAGKIEFKPNRLAKVGVYHGAGCRIWKGGLCNCDAAGKCRPVTPAV